MDPMGYMDVSKNSGISKSSILIGFSIINHPFCGTPIFGNIHIHQLNHAGFFVKHICPAWAFQAPSWEGPGLGCRGAPNALHPGTQEIRQGLNTPLKTNMSPENQWLEDVFPIEIVPFLGDMLVFWGVRPS